MYGIREEIGGGHFKVEKSVALKSGFTGQDITVM